VSDIDIQEPVKDATAQIKVAVGDAVVSNSQLTIQMTLKLVKTCVHVAEHFITDVLLKYSDSDNLNLSFDRYNVPSSLKMATRVSRQGRQQLDSHCITDGPCAGFCFLQTQNCIFFFSQDDEQHPDKWKAFSCGAGKSVQSYSQRHVLPSQ